MTDLLRTGTRRTASDPSGRPTRRSLVPTAAFAGALSSGTSLMLLAGLALVGWFAADAGRYGDTTDAVRVGADSWLLAHGAGLRLEAVTVTVIPLGLSLLCGWVAYRGGRWAGASSRSGSDWRVLLTGIGVQATVYAVVAVLAAVLAATGRAEVGLLGAFWGGLVLSLVFGGCGLLVGAGEVRRVLGALPPWGRGVLSGAAATFFLLLAASSFLVAAALLADFGSAATVLSRLHADGPGGLLYTLVCLTFVPNAALLGAAYLLGPGFMVGAGTVVSPTAVVIGPLPAFPLLAALPGEGPTPTWATALMGLPLLVAAVAVALVLRRLPLRRVEAGAMTGLAAGLLAAVILALLVGLAGGAAGPGRMADVGSVPGGVLLAAVLSLGGGGLLGGVAGVVWSRRSGAASTARASLG